MWWKAIFRNVLYSACLRLAANDFYNFLPRFLQIPLGQLDNHRIVSRDVENYRQNCTSRTNVCDPSLPTEGAICLGISQRLVTALLGNLSKRRAACWLSPHCLQRGMANNVSVMTLAKLASRESYSPFVPNM